MTTTPPPLHGPEFEADPHPAYRWLRENEPVHRVDLPGGDTAAMRRSLALLAGLPLPDATQVLPGHGELSTLGQERDTNPYLQGQWF